VLTNVGRVATLAAVATMRDRRIVAAGTADSIIVLVRCRPDGTLDPTFSDDGIATITVDGGASASDVLVKPFGSILVVGGSADPLAFLLARFRADGKLDRRFGDAGIVTTPIGDWARAAAVARDADGRFVVAGTSSRGFTAARYLPSGELDTSFDEDGVFTTPTIGDEGSINALALQDDGKIVLAGTTDSVQETVLLRLRKNGGLDPSFGGTGFAERLEAVDWFVDVAVLPDGRMLALATGEVEEMARFRSDGSLDPTFGTEGERHIGHVLRVAAIDIQADDRILVAGTGAGPTFALRRYKPIGRVDPSFGGGDGLVTTSFPVAGHPVGRDVALEPHGRIVVGGFISHFSSSPKPRLPDFALARYLAA